MSQFARAPDISDLTAAVVDIAEAMDAQAYSVHSPHDGQTGAVFSVMLSFTGIARIYQVRDKIRGRLQRVPPASNF